MNHQETPDNDSNIISDCYGRSVELLKHNSGPWGINAASHSKKATERHYANIFGRDAAICSLGMAVSGDHELIKSAKKSLLTLAKFQAPTGQIPKYVKPETEEVDFWYAGCIDATLWWLIAVDFFAGCFPDDDIRKRLAGNIDRAVFWLRCQEHQSLYLLQQNEASDWADIMPRSGFVLYSNALWYYVKKLFDIPHAARTKQHFRHMFYPFNKSEADNRRVQIMSHYIKSAGKTNEFYLSFVNLSFWGTELDVYANILSSLMGLSNMSKTERRVDEMITLKVSEPWPVKVVHSPIRSNSPLWRLYMERHEQNYPYQYHNGGIWPYVAGFWIMLLQRVKKKKLALHELERFAEVNRVNNWEFNEWFHGKTGNPMGMPGQSWNASMFLLAYHCLKDNINIFK